MTAGIYAAGARGGFNGAGMFPSQKCRGLIDGGLSRSASMGPGCFHPRNHADGYGVTAYFWLQWGRDVSIPEMSRPLWTETVQYWLQWGRDVSIPEISRPSAHFGTPSGFNGAGMFPSQKFGSAREGCPSTRASMGPGCFHPRNGPKRKGMALAPARFNGAGMFPSQKFGRASHDAVHTPRFNGAGMFPSQKSPRPSPSRPPIAGFNGAGMFPSQKSRTRKASGHDAASFNGAGMFPSQKSAR